MQKSKNSIGSISLVILAVTFLFASIIGLNAGKQVKKTQVSQSKAACDKPEGCGGQCNPSVNQGCYAGGCRAWEWCNPANSMCEWDQNKIGVNQKCEQKLSEGTILGPGQSSQQQVQPTQPQQQAQPTASNSQNSMSAGSCDPQWYCLGECAGPTPKAAFGNNAAQWRKEKANNEKKSGACDNPATTQGQASQQQVQPTPTVKPATGGIQPQPTQTPAPGGTGTASGTTGTTCTAGGRSYDVGNCQPAGTRKVVCDPTHTNAVRTTYNGQPYTGWVASDSCYAVSSGTSTGQATATSTPTQASNTGGTAIPSSIPLSTSKNEVSNISIQPSALQVGQKTTIRWKDTSKKSAYKAIIAVTSNNIYVSGVTMNFPDLNSTNIVKNSDGTYSYTFTLTEENVRYLHSEITKHIPETITKIILYVRDASYTTAVDPAKDANIPITVSSTATTQVVATPTVIQAAVASSSLEVHINPAKVVVGSQDSFSILITSNFVPDAYKIYFKLRLTNSQLITLKTISLSKAELEKISVRNATDITRAYNYIVQPHVITELADVAKQYDARIVRSFLIYVAVPSVSGVVNQSSQSALAREVFSIQDARSSGRAIKSVTSIPMDITYVSEDQSQAQISSLNNTTDTSQSSMQETKQVSIMPTQMCLSLTNVPSSKNNIDILLVPQGFNEKNKNTFLDIVKRALQYTNQSGLTNLVLSRINFHLYNDYTQDYSLAHINNDLGNKLQWDQQKLKQVRDQCDADWVGIISSSDKDRPDNLLFASSLVVGTAYINGTQFGVVPSILESGSTDIDDTALTVIHEIGHLAGLFEEESGEEIYNTDFTYNDTDYNNNGLSNCSLPKKSNNAACIGWKNGFLIYNTCVSGCNGYKNLFSSQGENLMKRPHTYEPFSQKFSIPAVWQWEKKVLEFY